MSDLAQGSEQDREKFVKDRLTEILKNCPTSLKLKPSEIQITRTYSKNITGGILRLGDNQIILTLGQSGVDSYLTVSGPDVEKINKSIK